MMSARTSGSDATPAAASAETSSAADAATEAADADAAAAEAAAEDVDSSTIDLLQSEISELKRQLDALRIENQELRRHQQGLANDDDGNLPTITSSPASVVRSASPPSSISSPPPSSSSAPSRYSSLSNAHIERYSRQILAGVGVEGQHKLLQAKVVVVGAGGIGSSCLLYLAGCGVGQLDVLDNDAVEVSNLHRQIIHSTQHCGMSKAGSAQIAVRQLNPTIRCEAIVATLTHDNAMELLERYDVIVDATDNPLTRYLINDAAVLLSHKKNEKVSVVFASAVATEAQITVFAHDGTSSSDGTSRETAGGGGCYRCLYPDPVGSVASNCASCSDAGVLGPVPGLVGVLQATEVIKLVTKMGTPLTNHILQYDALSCRFLRLKKPPRRLECASCGSGAGGTTTKIRSMHDSYESLRSVRGPNSSVAPCPIALAKVRNVSPQEYYPLWRQHNAPGQHVVGSSPEHPHLLLDVREPIQYDLCHLPGSVNIPLRQLPNRLDDVLELAAATVARPARVNEAIDCAHDDNSTPGEVLIIYCVCRRGIASTSAAALLAEWVSASQLPQHGTSTVDDGNLRRNDGCTRSRTARLLNVEIRNVRGGLDAWREQVDPSFPKY
jgi:adenylyltransferase and sulfurtransferase